MSFFSQIHLVLSVQILRIFLYSFFCFCEIFLSINLICFATKFAAVVNNYPELQRKGVLFNYIKCWFN